MTDRAIFTILYSLGLNSKVCSNVMERWECYKGMEKFEEIRHHEIQFFFPKVYRQRKYFE